MEKPGIGFNKNLVIIFRDLPVPVSDILFTIIDLLETVCLIQFTARKSPATGTMGKSIDQHTFADSYVMECIHNKILKNDHFCTIYQK
jgi:hypothetical protein